MLKWKPHFTLTDLFPDPSFTSSIFTSLFFFQVGLFWLCLHVQRNSDRMVKNGRGVALWHLGGVLVVGWRNGEGVLLCV